MLSRHIVGINGQSLRATQFVYLVCVPGPDFSSIYIPAGQKCYVPRADTTPFLSPNSSYCAHSQPQYGRMSFGFGIGDFIAVLTLANKVQNQFANAPKEL